MKRFLALFALAFTFIGAFADDLSDAVNSFGKTLTAVVVKQTNGYVTEETANEYMYSAFIKVPDYYDNELIISTINPIANDAGFITIKPWTAVDDGVISEYKLGDAAKINLRFDFIRHHLLILLQPIRE